MNLLEQLVSDRRERWGLAELGPNPRVVLVTPAYDTSRHVVGLVFGRDLQVVLKVSRRAGDDSGLQREAAVLRRLEQLRGRQDDVPRLLELEQVAGSTVLVETALHGPPLGPERVVADRQETLLAGTAFLDALPVTGTLTGWYAELVTAPVDRLRSSFPALEDLAARTHAALSELSQQQLPAVFEHGDFSHPNLLLVAPSRMGVVDWERSVERGVPGHDLVYLIAYVGEALTGAATLAERVASFERALLDPEGWGRPLLTAHLERRGVAARWLDPLLLLCVVRAACTLSDRLLGEAGEEPGADAAAVVDRDRDVVLWRTVLDRMRRHGS